VDLGVGLRRDSIWQMSWDEGRAWIEQMCCRTGAITFARRTLLLLRWQSQLPITSRIVLGEEDVLSLYLKGAASFRSCCVFDIDIGFIWVKQDRCVYHFRHVIAARLGILGVMAAV